MLGVSTSAFSKPAMSLQGYIGEVPTFDNVCCQVAQDRESEDYLLYPS